MATMHVGGLFSGMDTQATIDKLLELKRKPIELLQERRIGIEVDVAAWADLSTYMTDLTDALDTLRSWTVWNQMTGESSNPAAVTATATSAAAEGTYAVTVTRLAQAHTVASDRISDLAAGATASTDLVAAGVLTAGDTFVIEGQTLTIGASETLTTLQGKINTAADSMDAASRVTASLIDGHLVIARTRTGDTDIALADSAGAPLQALGLLDSAGAAKNELVPSQDAQFTVNGIAITRSVNTSLDDVIQNVTLNLLQTTAAGESVTLALVRDRESVKTAILDFVDKYNALAEQLREAGRITLSGSTARGAEVEDTGELHDDSLVREIYANIRKQVTAPKYPYLNPTNAAYTYGGRTDFCDSLSDLGIWTAGEDNLLAVDDEERLDSMLANHFDEAEQLFRGTYVAGTGYTHGVASDFYRYSDSVSASMLGAIAQRTGRLNDQIDQIDEDISNLEDGLDDYEQRLWEQFASMETAVQKMQSDLQWLQSQLGGS